MIAVAVIFFVVIGLGIAHALGTYALDGLGNLLSEHLGSIAKGMALVLVLGSLW